MDINNLKTKKESAMLGKRAKPKKPVAKKAAKKSDAQAEAKKLLEKMKAKNDAGDCAFC